MNPEFQRNLYLEFSYARLVGTPLFLSIIFALTYLISSEHWGDMTANTALGLYVFIVLFWGARQSTESILDELRNHTWDIQKTSAISPWSLAWGKLFGSTLFNWYGGLFCLVVYAATTSKPEFIFAIIGYSIGCGLLAQALGLLISLFALGKKQTFNPSLIYLFVLFLLFFCARMVWGINDDQLKMLHWYGFEIESHVFGLISLGLACIWSIVGIYRLLAQELQIRTLPWVWLVFVVFLIVYIHGFILGNSYHDAHFNANYISVLVAFTLCCTLTYCLIFLDNNSPMQMRKLWVYAKQENWLRFLEEIPIWLINLSLSLPIAVYLSLIFPTETADDYHLYAIPLFLLMLRDCALVLFFNYGANPKRAFSLSILYLTFLYWIIPAIFIALDANILATLFIPLLTGNLASAIALTSGQVAIVGYLLFNRWQKRINQAQNHA